MKYAIDIKILDKAISNLRDAGRYDMSSILDHVMYSLVPLEEDLQKEASEIAEMHGYCGTCGQKKPTPEEQPQERCDYFLPGTFHCDQYKPCPVHKPTEQECHHDNCKHVCDHPGCITHVSQEEWNKNVKPAPAEYPYTEVTETWQDGKKVKLSPAEECHCPDSDYMCCEKHKKHGCGMKEGTWHSDFWERAREYYISGDGNDLTPKQFRMIMDFLKRELKKELEGLRMKDWRVVLTEGAKAPSKIEEECMAFGYRQAMRDFNAKLDAVMERLGLL